jgi:hypothetical protein
MERNYNLAMRSINKKWNLILLSMISMMLISAILSGDLNGVTNDIKDIYLYYYARTFLGGNISVFNVIISAFPTMIVISIFADDLSFDLEKNAQYIFTRTRDLKKWVINRFVHMLSDIMKIQFIQFSISFVYFIVLGYKFYSLKDFYMTVIVLFSLTVLTQYVLIIIANLITLKTNNVCGYIISSSIFLLSIIIFHLLYLKKQVLVNYIPSTPDWTL